MRIYSGGTGGGAESAEPIEVARGIIRSENLLDRLPLTDTAERGVFLSDAAVEAVVDAAQCLRSSTDAERMAAPVLASRLERHPEIRARILIDNDSRFQNWGLVEELIARSRDAVFGGDPRRGVRLARLGASVADRLDPSRYGSTLAADLRARAWGNLGNAYRCAGQLRAAAAALREADDLLLDGTGDPLEIGNVLSLRASLATSRGEIDLADDLLDQALALYEEIDELQLQGKILVKKAAAYGDRTPSDALACSLQAERLLDPEEDPRLYFTARHNRITWLIASGHAAEAERLLAASRRLYRRFDDPWTDLLLAWAEARLAFALGNVEDSEQRFQALLDLLLERNQQLDAAVCALELSTCKVALGDLRSASELVATMAHHLREWGAHAHAREAWSLLQHYLSLESATEELAHQLAAYLRRAWKNPRLAFRPRLDR